MTDVGFVVLGVAGALLAFAVGLAVGRADPGRQVMLRQISHPVLDHLWECENGHKIQTIGDTVGDRCPFCPSVEFSPFIPKDDESFAVMVPPNPPLTLQDVARRHARIEEVMSGHPVGSK